MIAERINLDKAALHAFCERHGVAYLSFFGSILREDFCPESDVDILIEFRDNVRTGFFKIAMMKRELENLFGRDDVQISTPDMLSRFFRDEVRREAMPFDAAA